MTVHPADQTSLHDPLEWLSKLIFDDWRSARAERPEIGPRASFDNVNTRDADFVLLYSSGDDAFTQRGPRHFRDEYPVSFDIRAETRARALALRDEVRRILERNIVAPDPYGEWDTISIRGMATAADYSDYQQIVIDATLSKAARAKTLPRVLGG